MIATPMSMAKDHATKWVKLQMVMSGKNQTECAEKIAISQQAFSQKIKKGNFTISEMIVLADLFGSSISEVGALFWIESSDQEGRFKNV